MSDLGLTACFSSVDAGKISFSYQKTKQAHTTSPPKYKNSREYSLYNPFTADSISLLSTDAISRTAFAYSIAESKGPIADLLKRLGSFEENSFTVLLQLILDRIPSLASLPNPVMNKYRRLRRELREVADDVWHNGARLQGGHAELLIELGTNCISEDELPSN